MSEEDNRTDEQKKKDDDYYDYYYGKHRKRDWLGSYFFKNTGYVHPHYHKYEPFYDEHADYNTNAKSYYDYLARFNGLIRWIVDFINRLMNRNIEVKDTDSIDFKKKGDWLDNGECEPDNYDDIVTLSAVVNISNTVEERKLVNTTVKNFSITNGSVIKNDGLWSPDYIDMIKALDNSIGDINNKFEDLENAIKKIVENLYKSGAITNNDIYNFEFKTDRDIATGNINLFGGKSDGNKFIRTNDGKTENDITAGY